MEGWLPIFFLLVILKIPVLGALWLVYWASQPPVEEPEVAEEPGGGMGRKRPEPNRPKWPRRGGPPTGGAGALREPKHGGRSRVFNPPAPARAAAARAARRAPATVPAPAPAPDRTQVDSA